MQPVPDRVQNITFQDVHKLVKGGHPLSDSASAPPELGVGQYNVANLKIQPSYGLWARHVRGLTVKESSFNYEKQDSRFAVFLEDVVGGQFSSVKMVKARDNQAVIKLKSSPDITIENTIYFHDEWGKAPAQLPRLHHTSGTGDAGFPGKRVSLPPKVEKRSGRKNQTVSER